MKVLFISSGNMYGNISPIIMNQAESLINNGIEVKYFAIKGKGWKSYYKAILRLKRVLQFEHYDAFHAHYSLSAYVAALAGAQPLVVSLMGSDLYLKPINQFIIRFFMFFFWRKTIVKSKKMKIKLGKEKNVSVIPNGINLKTFHNKDKFICRKMLNWNNKKRHVLFAANPNREVKNFSFLQQAINLLNNKQLIDVHYSLNIPHNSIPIYMNASDIVVLPSLWEGSPNVIKEAMACNCPIVATDVGDIKWLFGEEKGHYLSNFDANNFGHNIKLALDFSIQNKKTNGRQRIIELGLSSENIAKRIIEIYKTIV